MPLDCMAWRVEKGLLNKKTNRPQPAEAVMPISFESCFSSAK